MENCKDKALYQHLRKNETENRWVEKIIFGQFHRNTENQTDREKIWPWITKTDLKQETKALICAAQ